MRVQFELGCALDFLGKEARAIVHYEIVRKLGVGRLPESLRPRLYLQLGSSLRNVKRFFEARKILETGVRKHPSYGALRIFLAFACHSCGDSPGASKALFEALARQRDESWDIYEAAIRRYARGVRFQTARHGRFS